MSNDYLNRYTIGDFEYVILQVLSQLIILEEMLLHIKNINLNSTIASYLMRYRLWLLIWTKKLLIKNKIVCVKEINPFCIVLLLFL